MSKEIHLSYESGNNLYAIVRRPSDGKVWDVAGGDWATWSDGNIDNYDIALTDKSGDFYTADFPTHANVGAGRFEVALFLRAGASPATSDNLIGRGIIAWNESAEVFGFETDGGLTAAAILDVNAQVDAALDTQMPASPTSGSVNAALKSIDTEEIEGQDATEQIRDAVREAGVGGWG